MLESAAERIQSCPVVTRRRSVVKSSSGAGWDACRAVGDVGLSDATICDCLYPPRSSVATTS